MLAKAAIAMNSNMYAIERVRLRLTYMFAPPTSQKSRSK